MNYSYYKIKSRAILMKNCKNAKTVFVICALSKLVFLCSTALCLRCIAMLYRKETGVSDTLQIYILYALFSAGVIFSVYFLTLVDYNEKRWYWGNSWNTRKISYLFAPAKISKQIKIVYIYLLKAVIFAVSFIFYELPAIATAFITLEMLPRGIAKIPFVLLTAMFAVFFFGGVYFSLVSIQKYAYTNEEFFINNNACVTDAVNNSKLKTQGICFTLCNFRLSFILWFALCVLIIPLFFVVPYYRQASALLNSQRGIKIHRPVEQPQAVRLRAVRDSI